MTDTYELPALPQPALMQPESEHDGDGGPLVSYYTADQVRAAILAERERCAAICDRLSVSEYPTDCDDCAAAIRAG